MAIVPLHFPERLQLVSLDVAGPGDAMNGCEVGCPQLAQARATLGFSDRLQSQLRLRVRALGSTGIWCGGLCHIMRFRV